MRYLVRVLPVNVGMSRRRAKEGDFTLLAFTPGRYIVRFAASADDLAAALALRWCAFHDARGRASRAGGDADTHDAACRHVLIEDHRTGTLVACFRLSVLKNGVEIGQTYSAQFYDLSALADYRQPMAELSRFCLRPDCHDPDVLRTAWGALARFVDDQGIAMLFGCASFAGTDSVPYEAALAALAQKHLGPRHWQPRVKSKQVLRFARDLSGRAPDPVAATRTMPPLLRSYLALGGWVSDHAVIDHDLDTLHVFTGMEICAIPPGRARVLRAICG